MQQYFGATEWCAVLAETRLALSSLRADDLQTLALRAETIFNANPRLEIPKQQRPDMQRTEVAGLTRECRLLSDLLLATDRNLAVLRRLRHPAGDDSQAEGVDPRWVR